MKIIFFGTPKFAGDILSYLIENDVEVLAVVAQPDHQEPSAIKKIVKQLLFDIPIYQPERVSDPKFIQDLVRHQADLFVVVAYGQILTQDLLDLPPLGCINVHASLLPKYRGAAPIQRALMNGEKRTGITIMKMIAQMDAGDIIRTADIDIDEDMNFEELESILLFLAQPLLLGVIRDFEKGKVKSFPQDPSLVTFAPKIKKEECEIDWNSSAKNLHNLIRALSPKPAAYCWVEIGEKRKLLKIIKAKTLSTIGQPAEIITLEKNRLIVGCKRGALEILEVQLEGKKRMEIAKFLQGIKGKILFYRKRI